MFFNWGVDTENVVYLHNKVLLNNKKQWIHEILKQIDGTRKYPGWYNPITKEHTWYALTVKWLLVQKLGISKLQLTEHMKLKKKDQNVGASVFIEGETKYPWG